MISQSGTFSLHNGEKLIKYRSQDHWHFLISTVISSFYGFKNVRISSRTLSHEQEQLEIKFRQTVLKLPKY